MAASDRLTSAAAAADGTHYARYGRFYWKLLGISLFDGCLGVDVNVRIIARFKIIKSTVHVHFHIHVDVHVHVHV